jgi:hypothetical protein
VKGTVSAARAAAVYCFSSPSAGVAKLADARDSKSRSLYGECGFNSLLRHHSTRPEPPASLMASHLAWPEPPASLMASHLAWPNPLPRSWQAIWHGRTPCLAHGKPSGMAEANALSERSESKDSPLLFRCSSRLALRLGKPSSTHGGCPAEAGTDRPREGGHARSCRAKQVDLLHTLTAIAAEHSPLRGKSRGAIAGQIAENQRGWAGWPERREAIGADRAARAATWLAE